MGKRALWHLLIPGLLLAQTSLPVQNTVFCVSSLFCLLGESIGTRSRKLALN